MGARGGFGPAVECLPLALETDVLTTIPIASFALPSRSAGRGLTRGADLLERLGPSESAHCSRVSDWSATAQAAASSPAGKATSHRRAPPLELPLAPAVASVVPSGLNASA